MCDCEFGETPTVWRASLVRARKEHKCYECPRTIRVGERYERSTSLYEGRWDSLAVCRRCAALREAWHDVEGCWALYGNLRDSVLECIREEWMAFGRRDQDRDEDFVAEDDLPDAAEPCLELGARYRVHLGLMGPRRPREQGRRAA